MSAITEAHILYDSGKKEEAKKNLLKIIEDHFFDVDSEIFFFLGKIFLEENNSISGKFYLEKFLDKSSDTKSILEVSIVYLNNGLYEDLIILLNDQIKLNGINKEFFYYKSRAFHYLGKTWLALININKAIKLDNEYIEAHFVRLSYFPYIYKTNNEIRKFRLYYEKNLDLFIDKFINKKKITEEDSILITSKVTNFLLAYQGLNDKDLQMKYSKILSYFLSFIKIPNKIVKTSSKINIGFVTYFFHQHTITNLFKNWILNLDKNIFNISIFNCGPLEDEVTHHIKQFAHNYYQCTFLNDQINKIIKESLDIIIFFDMGMSAQTQLLSVAKLAKYQFIAWGHPITTGSNKIDYYLSSELMEGDNSQNFYTEKLIKLKDIGINYDFSAIKNTDIDSNTENEQHNFICLQNLRKIIPDNDQIICKVLSLGMGLSFFSDKINYINSHFYKRIEKNAKKNNINVENSINFIQPCSRSKFLQILNNSKVVLDTIGWSGGNTHLEALYLNKPIVTMSGKYLRSNHTFAFLKLIKVEELIAKDENQYLKIAQNLIVDEDYRLFIINKIKTNKNLLFQNKNSSFNEFILNFTKLNKI